MIEEKGESAKVIFNVRSWKIKQKHAQKDFVVMIKPGNYVS